jgi:pimeloyl-ACP methyl ester carboxylesterase
MILQCGRKGVLHVCRRESVEWQACGGRFYSENGWAVKDGVQRTHQLLGIFTSKFGQPTRVYISGASMGGLIAIELAEKYPGVITGALPTCAVAGGALWPFDYLANVPALRPVLSTCPSELGIKPTP